MGYFLWLSKEYNNTSLSSFFKKKFIFKRLKMIFYTVLIIIDLRRSILLDILLFFNFLLDLNHYRFKYFIT